jgi:hypothetical protein
MRLPLTARNVPQAIPQSQIRFTHFLGQFATEGMSPGVSPDDRIGIEASLVRSSHLHHGDVERF